MEMKFSKREVNKYKMKENRDTNKQLIFFNSVMLEDPNRGCQALTLGSLYFISDYLKTDDFDVISPSYYLRKKREDKEYKVKVNNENITITRRYYWLPPVVLGALLSKLFGRTIKIGQFGKDLKRVQYTFSIAGGDGFSDIYSFSTFKEVNRFTFFSAVMKSKTIILPQTIGPFYSKKAKKVANIILNNAEKIYVRDLSYVDELKKKNLIYSLDHDVSKYMLPQKVVVEVPDNAVGVNISGLLYNNNFRNLAGRSPLYRELIKQIIEKFQQLNVPVVLIPHTYDCENPIDFEDDLLAIKNLFSELTNKNNVSIIDKDYSAPELKYIISKCDYFIGSRMHANFAAIYTNVPVFGLAYSYKFSGAFSRYSLEDSTTLVLDIGKDDIQHIIIKLMDCYKKRNEKKQLMMNSINS